MAIGKRLPGETPLDDISGLKVKGVMTRGRLNLLEAENVRRALVKYLAKRPTRRSAPFDYSWCLKLHKEMFGAVWKWAGVVRVCDLNIGVAWQVVEPSLYQLTSDLAFWEQRDVDLLDQAVRLHHRAVQIHPFLGGNGRWARLLSNIWLRRHDRPLTAWPEETVGTVSVIRQEYLAALRQADQGDIEPLTEMHRRFASS